MKILPGRFRGALGNDALWSSNNLGKRALKILRRIAGADLARRLAQSLRAFFVGNDVLFGGHYRVGIGIGTTNCWAAFMNATPRWFSMILTAGVMLNVMMVA